MVSSHIKKPLTVSGFLICDFFKVFKKMNRTVKGSGNNEFPVEEGNDTELAEVESWKTVGFQRVR